MTESALQRAIVGYLHTAGIWVIRTGVSRKRGKSGTQSGEPGFPDLYLPGLGHIEVKMPGEKLSAEQAAWHAKAERHGVRTAVAHAPKQALEIALAWRRGFESEGA
jgi:hypothetical protein